VSEKCNVLKDKRASAGGAVILFESGEFSCALCFIK
jgi:hypothetical protein